MFRNAGLILKCNQKICLVNHFFLARQNIYQINAAMSVTKLPAFSPVIKFTQTDLELYLKILIKIEYHTQLSLFKITETL